MGVGRGVMAVWGGGGVMVGEGLLVEHAHV